MRLNGRLHSKYSDGPLRPTESFEMRRLTNDSLEPVRSTGGTRRLESVHRTIILCWVDCPTNLTIYNHFTGVHTEYVSSMSCLYVLVVYPSTDWSRSSQVLPVLRIDCRWVRSSRDKTLRRTYEVERGTMFKGRGRTDEFRRRGSYERRWGHDN